MLFALEFPINILELKSIIRTTGSIVFGHQVLFYFILRHKDVKAHVVTKMSLSIV